MFKFLASFRETSSKVLLSTGNGYKNNKLGVNTNLFPAGNWASIGRIWSNAEGKGRQYLLSTIDRPSVYNEIMGSDFIHETKTSSRACILREAQRLFLS